VFAALNDGLIDPVDSVRPASVASALVLVELVGLVGDASSPHPTATAAVETWVARDFFPPAGRV
jgi:hypothetical protein